MKKAIVLLACTLAISFGAEAKSNTNVTPSSGVIKAVYNSLLGCSVSPNQAKKVKAFKTENTKPKRHVPKITRTIKPAPGNSSFKSYMDARTITDRSTKQYELKSKYKLDSNGLYTVNGRYCIAVGSYYTQAIGTKLDVRLDSGETLECILAECKRNKDTDSTNRQNPNGSVIEFVVYTPCLHRLSRLMGSCEHIPGFSGNVVEIAVIQEE